MKLTIDIFDTMKLEKIKVGETDGNTPFCDL